MIKRKKNFRCLPIWIFLAIGESIRSNAYACSVCYGDAGSQAFRGLRMAIVTLLFILVSVLGCFVAFILHLRKREKFLVH